MKKKVGQSGLKVLLLLLISVTTYSQTSKQGKVVVQKFLAPSIQNNKGGEDHCARFLCTSHPVMIIAMNATQLFISCMA
jgi:hypothetical protein